MGQRVAGCGVETWAAWVRPVPARWLALGLLLASPLALADAACLLKSGKMVQPLVELYTSEGCSSCPPADAWLAKARADRGANWLAFHVDYWDALGWRDRFGEARHSERQRSRVTALGKRTVFTPQVMSGENVRVDWRDDGAWRAALAAQRAQPSPVAIEIRHERGSRRLDVTATTMAGAAMVAPALWIAELESGLRTDVRAGENARRTLHHDAVVRRLHGPFAIRAREVAVSRRVWVRALDGQPAQVIAWVEDGRQVPRQSLGWIEREDCGAR
jgi:hypothetical protein